MTHTVIGFFRNSSDAYNAADILKERGFDINNVDVSAGYGSDETRNDTDRDEKSGKIGNFFRSLFSDDNDRNDVDRYSRAARDNSLVTVHASSRDEAERAADILDSCGAIDIDEGGSYAGEGSGRFSDTDYELRGSGVRDTDAEYIDPDLELDRSGRVGAGSDYDLRGETSGTSFTTGDRDITMANADNDFERARFTSDKDFDRTTDASIPIIEEEVNVGKREVRRGGVRVRSRIIERPVEETLRLREERVRVERTPADREATEAELENFHEDTIEVHEYGEEPIVSKHSRVVEEVKVGKDVHERHETVREKARKTEVDIENLEDEDKIRSHKNR